MRKTVAAWMVVLLGAIAAAAMVPQFAIFIPIVAIAWILARFDLLPSFVRHRHATTRLALGAEAPLTSLSAVIEADERHETDEKAVVERILARVDAIAGPRAAGEGCVTWGARAERESSALQSLEPALAEWPELRAPLQAGARIVLATRVTPAGRSIRLQACLAGERDLVEPASLDAAADLRKAGIEVVTTGRLRHEERLRAARRRATS